MITLTRGLAVGTVLAGVAVGLASPALAEPLSGTYTATMIDGGGVFNNGATTTWTLSPCGPDCTRLTTGHGPPEDLHLQGNMWTVTNVNSKGATCNDTLDNTSLIHTSQCGNGPTIVVGLTKIG